MANDGVEPLAAALATALGLREQCVDRAAEADAAGLAASLSAYCTALDGLIARKDVDAINTLPVALQLDVCADFAWRKLRSEQSPAFVLALWRLWEAGTLHRAAEGTRFLRTALIAKWLWLMNQAGDLAIHLFHSIEISRFIQARVLAEVAILPAEDFVTAGVREQVLTACRQAGHIEHVHQMDAHAAHLLYRRGMEFAETFFSSGETSVNIKSTALWLFTRAGFGAAEQDTKQLHQCGLEYAESVLAAGETAAEVREQVLLLFKCASVSTQNLIDRHKLERRGLQHAEAFIDAGEVSAGVREVALWLFVSAGLSAADPTSKHEFFRRGLMRAEAILASGENAAGVREEALKLYVNAGFNATDLAAGHSFYQVGLAHVEAFLAAGEAASGVRDAALWLFSNAGGSAADLIDRHSLELRGLQHAENFIAAGETAAKVREKVLFIFFNASVSAPDKETGHALELRGLRHAENFLAAGESDIGVHEQALRLFVRAGCSAADQAVRHDLNLRGLQYVESIIACSEVSVGLSESAVQLFYNAYLSAGDLFFESAVFDRSVRKILPHAEVMLAAGKSVAALRERALWVFLSVNKSTVDQFDRHDLFVRGIQHAEAMLTVGENDSGLREKALLLFIYAGASATDPDAARALYLRGLEHAEIILAAGESAAGVSEQVIKLFDYAGSSVAESGARLALYLRGLQHAEVMIAAGECSVGVREQILRLFANAGYDFTDQAVRHSLCLRGLQHVEDMLVGENSAGVLEQAFRLFVVASLSAPGPGSAYALCLRGLLHFEAIIPAGKNTSGVYEQVFKLFSSASISALLQHRSETGLVCQLKMWMQAWSESCPPVKDVELPAAFEQLREIFLPVLRGISCKKLQSLWLAVLLYWLCRLQPATSAGLSRYGLQLRLNIAHALLALESAEAGHDYARHHRALAETLAAIEAPWREECARLDGQIGSLRQRLPAAVVTRPDDRLAALGFWARLRHAGTDRRLQDALARRQVLAAGPVVAQQLRRRLDRCEREFIDWLAAAVLQHCALPAQLSEPAAIAIGLLYASQTEAADTVLARWQRQAPWQDESACRQAWAATDPAAWTLFDDDARAALYVWLQRRPALQVDSEFANSVEPGLDAAVRAWSAGDAQPLCTMLRGGWEAACAQAGMLARCLAALCPEMHRPDLRICATSLPAGYDSTDVSALHAVLLGRSRERLAEALRGWIDAQLPLDGAGGDAALLQRMRARHARLASLHPGPPAQHELGERLHGWAQALLGQWLAEPQPPLEAIWQTLEQARIGLNGLHLSMPSEKWQRQTTELIRDALLATPALPPTAGLDWPPLQRWLEQINAPDGLPRLPDSAAVSRRLHRGEALVQVLFDPRGGRLKALWLQFGQPLELRSFPPADAWGVGVLASWQDWTRYENSVALGQLWPALVGDKDLQATCTTLADWARQAGLQRLVVIWPAELAQLPWEAFAPFVDGATVLERAVNLSTWRTQPAEDAQTPWVAYVAEPGHGGFAIEALAGDSARAWNVAAQPCGAGVGDGISGFDLQSRLSEPGAGHLILHGAYRADEPRLSRLEVGSGEHLPAWTLAALGVRSPLLLLSACQANLSGRTTRGLLGPVGVGPTLVAAGARCVLGALWRCDAVAAWLLHRFLREALSDPEIAGAQGCGWRALQQARTRLRGLENKEVEALLRAQLGDAVFGEIRFDFDDYLLPERPFDNPYYWAAFVLLGDPDAMAGMALRAPHAQAA